MYPDQTLTPRISTAKSAAIRVVDAIARVQQTARYIIGSQQAPLLAAGLAELAAAVRDATGSYLRPEPDPCREALRLGQQVLNTAADARAVTIDLLRTVGGNVDENSAEVQAEWCGRAVERLLESNLPTDKDLEELGVAIKIAAEQETTAALRWPEMTATGQGKPSVAAEPASETTGQVQAPVPPAPAVAVITQAHALPARHSPDFCSVHWHGQDYSFTLTQGKVVKVLWESWEKGTPDVHQQTLLVRV